MLTIRKAQLAAFDAARLTRLAAEVAPERGLDRRAAVALVLRMAGKHGLGTEEDVHTLVAIAAALGQPDFDLRPENEWMHAKLRDATISSISRRLVWVAGEVQRRRALARHNAEIEAGLGHLLHR